MPLGSLSFEKLHIVDIGVSTISEDWQHDDSVLLGALHVHEGISVDDRFSSNLRTVRLGCIDSRAFSKVFFVLSDYKSGFRGSCGSFVDVSHCCSDDANTAVKYFTFFMFKIASNAQNIYQTIEIMLFAQINQTFSRQYSNLNK